MEGKAPLQHHKYGNKDFGKVLIDWKVSLSAAERLDLMALERPLPPQTLLSSHNFQGPARLLPYSQRFLLTPGIHPTGHAGMNLQPWGRAHTVFNFPKDATHPTATASLLPLCSISTGGVLDSGQILHGIFTGTAAGI